MQRASGLLLILAILAVLAQGWRFISPPEALRLGEAIPQGSLVVLFRPDDCKAYGSAVALLNEAANSGLYVWGSIVDNQGRASDAPLRGVSTPIEFPVRPESAHELVKAAQALGYINTPLVMKTDSEGRIRRVLPPLDDATVHRAALEEMVQDLAGALGYASVGGGR